MTIHALMIMSALAAEPSMTCEDVAIEAHYVITEAQQYTDPVHLQQYYDEIGKGEAMLKVIDHAYSLPVSDSEIGERWAAAIFKIQFEKEC